jgi:hypothetical protein
MARQQKGYINCTWAIRRQICKKPKEERISIH